jgi:hypothetical protein
MARATEDVKQEPLSVRVDDCRVRIQTGESITFLDARKSEDRSASGLQITGTVPHPPDHKHNYLVVYCA